MKRFWDKVNKTEGCWLWTAKRHSSGNHGAFFLDGKHRKAHRVSWEMHNGTIPDGLHVLHTCDTPYCVNPEHLYVGSHQDNMRDRESKKRGKLPAPRMGTAHHNAKLSEQQVLEIVEASKTGKPFTRIAAAFGINDSTVHKIAKGLQWSRVTGIVNATR